MTQKRYFFILRSEYYRKNDQIDSLKNSLFVKT